jgi:hypothetical protein
MAKIRQEEFLTNEEERTEGYMVAVEADTYEEARAIAYRRWAEMKPEVQRRVREETMADIMRSMLGI